ncbi:MAG: lysoplasmalogenase [Gemmatimonadaceae bacterium]
MIRLLSALLAISVALLIRAMMAGALSQVYVFKPLATCLVIALALGDTRQRRDPYGVLVGVGLLFSLVGDVLLMLPRDLFVLGLASFLVAHLCYLRAFTRDGGFSAVLATGVPLLLAGGVTVWLLWPGLGALRIPVIVYVLAMVVMAWQALERWRLGSHGGARLAAIGALLFMLSDGALGVSRFRVDFSGSGALVLVTYYAAQWSIAMSVRRRGRRSAAGSRPTSAS